MVEEDDDDVSGFEIERPYYFDGPHIKSINAILTAHT